MTNKRDHPVVLCVEDDPAQQELFRAAFARVHEGAQIAFVETGHSILKSLEADDAIVPGSGDPDLYVVDLCGTGGAGADLIQALREHPRTQLYPIIVLSGVQSASDIDACFRAGANAYFLKPMLVSELESILTCINEVWFKTGLLPKRISPSRSETSAGD